MVGVIYQRSVNQSVGQPIKEFRGPGNCRYHACGHRYMKAINNDSNNDDLLGDGWAVGESDGGCSLMRGWG